MNPTVELQRLRSKATDVRNELTEVYNTYVGEVDGDFREEFNQIYRSILAEIRKVRRAINVLALNGFIWTQKHTNSIMELLDSISDMIENMGEVLFQARILNGKLFRGALTGHTLYVLRLLLNPDE